MFSGAGVLIFFNKHLIIFREKKYNHYTEPGGTFDDKHTNIEETAKEELFEETCGLFNIEHLQTKNNYFDVYYNKRKHKKHTFSKKYRVYIIDIVGKNKNLIPKMINGDFKSNLDMLTFLGAKNYYLETNDVTIVDIHLLKDKIFSGDELSNSNIIKNTKNVYVNDINGKKIKIKKRLIHNLITMFTENDTIHLKPKKVKIKRIEDKKSGLVSYLLE